MNHDRIHALIGHHIPAQVAPTLVVLCLTALLVACGSKGVIQTSDESADYRNARSLPPLNKPSQATRKTPKEETLAGDNEDLGDEDVAPSDSPVLAAQDLDYESSALEQSGVVAEVPVPEQATQPSTKSALSLSAKVIDTGEGHSRLEISAGLQDAWRYLNATLQKSDVTVFSRNKTAGRFAVGCAGIAEDVVRDDRNGGWLFFKRGSNDGTEYCSLKIDQKRDVTQVSVLDRNGAEVSSDNSAGLFSRILSN